MIFSMKSQPITALPAKMGIRLIACEMRAAFRAYTFMHRNAGIFLCRQVNLQIPALGRKKVLAITAYIAHRRRRTLEFFRFPAALGTKMRPCEKKLHARLALKPIMFRNGANFVVMLPLQLTDYAPMVMGNRHLARHFHKYFFFVQARHARVTVLGNSLARANLINMLPWLPALRTYMSMNLNRRHTAHCLVSRNSMQSYA